MVDPVTAIGLVATAGQLAQQACSIFVALFSYFKDLHDAPADSKALRSELDLLVDVLNHIEETFQGREIPLPIQKSLEQINQWLSILEAKIQKKEITGLRRLQWPFKKQETKELISKIDRIKADMQSTISSESLFIPSVIHHTANVLQT
jgi:hypothetical protein